jgi:hypothetical protein
MKANKAKIVEFALRKVIDRYSLTGIKYNKVKEISYSKKSAFSRNLLTSILGNLSKIIEESYSRINLQILGLATATYTPSPQYSVHMPTILEAELTNPNEIDLPQNLLNFLTERFPENPDNVKMLFASIVYSCFLQKEKYIDCDIFYNFCNHVYQPLELSYFMFVRALIEKESRRKIFDFEHCKSIDIRTFYLNMH